MFTSKKFEIIKNARLVTVIGTGALGILAVSFIVAHLARIGVSSGATISDLTATLLGGTLIGLFVTGLFCLLAFHAFSFFESATLPQAIRLNEAMRMLHAKTNRESLAALKYYRISVFKAKNALGDGVAENVPCKLISTFLSPGFLRSDQNAALGSDNHCCDFTHIQEIIAANKAMWSEAEEHVEEQAGDISIEVAALERKIADLHEEKKEATQKYTAAAGREARLKNRLAETESHMAVLVELANKVTNDFQPPHTITREGVKAKYIAIGKIYGITEAPSAYVDIFRKNMPKDIINWSGAPKQGSEEEKT
ncbi:MAG: hypothetical protein KH208_02255 [Desulfovibrio sp.]|uniref:hypothetical protein n=1 Tax=Desulfovibrio sp. TaxID=885 RepID=UPI0025BAC275|nr:hypothetical protein [Desulfovibrio sp.]MBS6828683.1 hypothetical protein [Desulfovibrio sp.]